MSVVNDRALAINLLESFLYIQRPILPPFFFARKQVHQTRFLSTICCGGITTGGANLVTVTKS